MVAITHKTVIRSFLTALLRVDAAYVINRMTFYSISGTMRDDKRLCTVIGDIIWRLTPISLTFTTLSDHPVRLYLHKGSSLSRQKYK